MRGQCNFLVGRTFGSRGMVATCADWFLWLMICGACVVLMQMNLAAKGAHYLSKQKHRVEKTFIAPGNQGDYSLFAACLDAHRGFDLELSVKADTDFHIGFLNFQVEADTNQGSIEEQVGGCCRVSVILSIDGSLFSKSG